MISLKTLVLLCQNLIINLTCLNGLYCQIPSQDGVESINNGLKFLNCESLIKA